MRSSTPNSDPVVANFVLADEINRAPAKVQSALLEVMAERHVSIGGKTYPMPDPFLVMATQNPIESEGVYPLPEAQRDRFLFKILVDYPSVEEEREIVYRMGVDPAGTRPGPRSRGARPPAEGRERASSCTTRWSTTWCGSSPPRARRPSSVCTDVDGWISYGASPRASLGIIAAARAFALIRGRDYVVPQDVLEVIPDVLRHRLVLSYDALADEVTPGRRHHPGAADRRSAAGRRAGRRRPAAPRRSRSTHRAAPARRRSRPSTRRHRSRRSTSQPPVGNVPTGSGAKPQCTAARAAVVPLGRADRPEAVRRAEDARAHRPPPPRRGAARRPPRPDPRARAPSRVMPASTSRATTCGRWTGR